MLTSGLVNERSCVVLLDDALPRFLEMRQLHLLEFELLSCEQAAILLGQLLQGRRDDVVLVEVGSIGVGRTLHGWRASIPQQNR